MHTQFNDAMQANLGFVVKQTAHIEAGVYEIKYPDLDYASLIPVDTSANPWVTSVTYYSMDKVGAAKWINGNGKDVPVVGTSMQQHETAVYTAGIGYDYGFEEVNQARMLGMALEAEKASAARRAYEQMVYDIAFTGDTEKGWKGLFNSAAVTAASVAADGTGSATGWSTKTPAQILRDVNDMITGIHTATKTSGLADTLLLPYTSFNAIASTARSDNSDTTILEFLQRANVFTANSGRPLTIRGHRGLETAGAANAKRMVAYRRDPSVLKLHIPMPHQFLPVQVDGLQFTVPGVFRLGGLDIRLPKEVLYRDGI
ncbi:hypothetical protein CSC94_12700 [Zhengella mangrovi]|uniref:DUF2184 domain-containing protein n=2 Tax=Zhengella mangrovi TaxID=1982044 RepID=A0A2G1QMG4_9HYPH|nr:hypothetical protein CSC94_12700 [Zhengella mangrovi]